MGQQCQKSVDAMIIPVACCSRGSGEDDDAGAEK